jgi:Putative adhesin
MSADWTITAPRVLDVGDDGERVRKLSVAIVGGRVDVVTHADSPTARVEVSGLEGAPLTVRWDGSKLKITHGVSSANILDKLRGALEGIDRNKAFISISIPEDAYASVSTVSASGLLAGMRAGAKANTVSGAMTIDDVVGPVDVNTVSGDVECGNVRGPFTVRSVSGAVTAQSSQTPEVSIKTVSGDITLDLTTAHASITSNSVSGDVTVRAPHEGYDVTANTASGQVVIDGRTIDKRHRQPGNRLTDGDGSLRLKANAVSGNVVVLKAVKSGSA